MALTAEQIKGRLRNIAKQQHADARILLRIYMMERFLERVAASKYNDNFIIKGGMLVTAMVGVSMRSTMDIDTSLKHENLDEEGISRIITEIVAIDLEDDILFSIKEISQVMDEMEYPGIRIALDAKIGGMTVPLKIDISTGDVVTPREIRYEFPMILEERKIPLWSYNWETILGEKIQTVLNRGILNTRMRDFYDIHILIKVYGSQISEAVLKAAYEATAKKRETTELLGRAEEILSIVEGDEHMIGLWKAYCKKYSYASGIAYEEVISSARTLISMIES